MSGDEPRTRGRMIRGLLGTVFTGTLVVVAGFAVGVVAGLAIEDPALVKDYATGASRSVHLDEPTDGASDADTEGLRAPPLQRLGFSIQVGAFADIDTARRLAEELENVGYPVYVASPEAGDEDRWRVRVGPLSTRERADRVADELRSERSLPTWVLDESAT